MYKELKEFVASQTFRGIIIGVCIMVLALLIFQAGTFVGYRKAAFSYHFGDNYYRAFGDRGPRPFQIQMRGGAFIDAHGAVGKIVSINLPLIVVADPENTEKAVLIGEDTVIRKFEETIDASHLAVDDFIVVLGTPNDDAQVEATLIRVLPPPPEGGVKMLIRGR